MIKGFLKNLSKGRTVKQGSREEMLKDLYGPAYKSNQREEMIKNLYEPVKQAHKKAK